MKELIKDFYIKNRLLLSYWWHNNITVEYLIFRQQLYPEGIGSVLIRMFNAKKNTFTFQYSSLSKRSLGEQWCFLMNDIMNGIKEKLNL